MTFRTAYGPRVAVQLICNDASRAKQSMKKECDINFIVGQYKKTGLITHVSRQAGYFDDVETIDFHQAMNIIAKAEQTFDQVPAHIRKKFGNDMGAFFEFAQDPTNIDDMVKMGLASPIEGYVAPPKQGGSVPSGEVQPSPTATP